jgi:integrase
MKSFESVFAVLLSAYLELRRSLGYRCQDATFLLHSFDTYVGQQNHTGPLTQELALDFAMSNPNSSTNYRAHRYRVVRHFSEYLAIYDPKTPRLDPKALPHSHARTPRHIYTDEEILRLLDEARRVSPRNPVRGLTFHAMIGLAASSGLRISEVVGLDRGDVDWKTGTLLIRHSKFGKSRLVPLHNTTLDVLRNYAAVRDASFPDCKVTAFFLNSERRRYDHDTLQQAFAGLARRAGLRGPIGRGSTFHDLRHRFAVKCLVTWYKAGIDVQGMLPALATYMGHVHFTDTAYYLAATAELLALSGARYQEWLDEKGEGAS